MVEEDVAEVEQHATVQEMTGPLLIDHAVGNELFPNPLRCGEILREQVSFHQSEGSANFSHLASVAPWRILVISPALYYISCGPTKARRDQNDLRKIVRLVVWELIVAL